MRRICYTFILLTTIVFSQSMHVLKDFEDVKQRLEKNGLSCERIDFILQSPSANIIETQAVNSIRDIRNIQKHRKAEAKANEEFLLKSALIKKHLNKYKKLYDKVENIFDVNREIIAAILQKETALGAFTLYKHNALSVYISMIKGLQVKDETGRAKKRLKRFIDFAKDNLVALITFYETAGKDILKADLRSSYAGAIGIPQFSPMHFDMILSPDNNKSLHHMPTAIYSTAQLLTKRFSWDNYLDFTRLEHLDDVIERWKRFKTKDTNFVYEENLEGMKTATFLQACQYDKEVTYVAKYVKILKRYNFSTNYALGILQIARASHE